MIIYGTKTFDLKTATFPFACTDCGHDQQQVHVHRTFLSLYFIPLIPFRKTGLIKCPMCEREVKKNKFFKELASKVNPAEAKFQFKSILKSAKTPLYAMALPCIVATLILGAISYGYYEDQKAQDQLKVYTQNPTENVMIIAKFKESPYPFQVLYIPEIHDEKAVVFHWKYGYETLRDAKYGLKSALNSIGNSTIKTNFIEPTVTSLKSLSQRGFLHVHPLDKKTDWRPFFSDQK